MLSQLQHNHLLQAGQEQVQQQAYQWEAGALTVHVNQFPVSRHQLLGHTCTNIRKLFTLTSCLPTPSLALKTILMDQQKCTREPAGITWF